MTGQMDRIEWKLDMILAELRGGRTGAAPIAPLFANETKEDVASVLRDTRSREVMRALRSMSMKQHATLQMVVRGANNQQIAERFGVSVNTAKVYLRSIAKKLGVHLRTEIVVKVLPIFSEMGEDEYQRMAKGLPKDWDATYDYARPQDDPFWSSYTGSRVKGEGDLESDEGDGIVGDEEAFDE